jgi:hypothetical protein
MTSRVHSATDLAVWIRLAEEVAVDEALRALDGDFQHAQRRRADAEIFHHREVHLVGVHEHALQHILQQRIDKRFCERP